MCHWRRVRNVYLRCGHAENLPDQMIECGSRNCKFSPNHPPSCQPPRCTQTCAQYRLYPELYSPNIDGYCSECAARLGRRG
ncbi:hypothetical protein BD626DRAFT_225253 [Schizophyllum amplum]|uniref:Uncharacterized protein n=1 Tax=Schizophyllum amplum TaxID=97359 RepID=A0A550BX93_9AGAR|nr:hypothetical protein BD626DRAFT_225253 [Auriculariopsis ampla]